MFNSEKFWNFIYSLTFIGAVVLFYKLTNFDETVLKNIRIYDLTIISLASYRLTRLLVYDKVFNFIRDFIVKSKSELGIIKSSQYFLTCPWCAGVWMTLLIFVLYFFVPSGKLLSHILAISGVASFFHITISLMGWISEERKLHLKELKKKREE